MAISHLALTCMGRLVVLLIKVEWLSRRPRVQVLSLLRLTSQLATSALHELN